MFLQINTIKYDTEREIMNIYENLQIVRTYFFTDMLLFVNIQSTSNMYWFIGIRTNEYKQITIRSLSTIPNIRSGIRWAKPKVILNYSRLPRYNNNYSQIFFLTGPRGGGCLKPKEIVMFHVIFLVKVPYNTFQL